MKKKVLHILTGMDRGGCEGNALCLILQMQNQEHHGLVLGGEGEMSAEFVSAGTQMQYLKPTSRLPWRLSAQVRQRAEDINPDGVIVWHGMVMLPEILHALHGTGIPVLVHGGNPAYGMPKRVDRRYWLVEKLLGRRSEATYVCCSKHVAESFDGSRYLRRFPTSVVPNGVRSPTVPPHEPRTIDVNLPSKVGMVARLDAIKDHVTLLRAFRIILGHWPQTLLEVVGDGAMRSELEALAAELGIARAVRFLGQVKDVYPVIQQWDVFAYATTSREGLGNALTEAMMAGLPCVATAVTPIREVAGEEGAVRLVDPGNPDALAAAIMSLLPDLDARRKLSAAARKRAEADFSTEVYAERYMQLLFPDPGGYH